MTKEIPSIDELMKMSNEFDDFAIEFCDKYRMSPVEMSGIFLARLARLAEDTGYTDLYRKLLEEIGGINVSQANTTSQSTALH